MSETSTSPTDILLFVTTKIDVVTLRNFLDRTGDPEQNEDEAYRLHFLTHKDLSLLDEEPKATQPAELNEDFKNPWVGASVQDVETFAMQAGICKHSGLFLLLDNQGISEETVIVAERARVDERNTETGNEQKDLRGFNKVRVPWNDAMAMFLNLWLANIAFEEFTTINGQIAYGGWYEWHTPF